MTKIMDTPPDPKARALEFYPDRHRRQLATAFDLLVFVLSAASRVRDIGDRHTERFSHRANHCAESVERLVRRTR